MNFDVHANVYRCFTFARIDISYARFFSTKARKSTIICANDTLFSRAFHTTSRYDFRAYDIRPCLFLATSKAKVRYDMSNKQTLSYEKNIRFMFYYFKYSLHISSQILFWGLEYSVLTISVLCLTDKSAPFCDTGSKYEVTVQ